MIVAAILAALALYDVVPYAPGREATTARDIRAVSERSGLDTFLYSVSLDPRGCPAFDNVKAATESYRRLKAELGDAPVKLGFLLQSILGHWPRVDREIEPWQRSVNEDGEVKRFCILDRRYQDYIRNTAAALAKEGPCFILGDDDIRAFSPKLECFCPLHTAEFNRRSGTAYTPEQYRMAVKSCAEGDAVAKVCAQLRDEITMTVARLIREGIDSVDPKIPAGACMPGAENLLVANRAKLLAGKVNPVTLRFANGKYSELGREDFAPCVLRTQAFIDYFRRDIDVMLDESDTCPHTLYARSGRSFVAKLALGLFSGLSGAKLWYVGMHKGEERVPEAYDTALGENRRLFEAMSRDLEGSVPLGVRIAAFRSPIPLRAGRAGFFADSEWCGSVLGVYGVPFRSDFSRSGGEPILLGGAEAVDRLSDGELREVLRGRVIADGAAAMQIARRGMADLLGCVPVENGPGYNIELVCATGSRPPISKAPDTPVLTKADRAATVYSQLRYSPTGSGDPNSSLVSAGSVLFTNATGGVVFTCSFTPSNGYTSQNLRRKAWLVGALRMLDPEFPAVCDNAEPNLTLARWGRDGRIYLITLNLSYDDIAALRYVTPRSMSGAETLSRDGVWRRAATTCSGGVWTVPLRLPCMGFSVIRFNPLR